jgi:hypothetical protein
MPFQDVNVAPYLGGRGEDAVEQAGADETKVGDFCLKLLALGELLNIFSIIIVFDFRS